MRKINRYLVIYAIALFVCATSKGQSLQHLKTIKTNFPVTVSTDLNHLYIANVNGDIIKYDTAGSQINIFSPNNGGIINTLEAHFTLKTFVFYKDKQTYLFLDKRFNSSPEYQISISEIDYIDLATFDGQRSLWLVDIGNLNLLKYDITINTITSNTALQNHVPDQINAFNFIKTYQHKVYINNKNTGIMVFDNLGNYIKTIPLKGLDFFDFKNDEIYFLQDSTIKFVNLYNYQERVIAIPQDKKYAFSIATKQLLFLFLNKSMEVYKILE